MLAFLAGVIVGGAVGYFGPKLYARLESKS